MSIRRAARSTTTLEVALTALAALAARCALPGGRERAGATVGAGAAAGLSSAANATGFGAGRSGPPSALCARSGLDGATWSASVSSSRSQEPRESSSPARAPLDGRDFLLPGAPAASGLDTDELAQRTEAAAQALAAAQQALQVLLPTEQAERDGARGRSRGAASGAPSTGALRDSRRRSPGGRWRQPRSPLGAARPGAVRREGSRRPSPATLGVDRGLRRRARGAGSPLRLRAGAPERDLRRRLPRHAAAAARPTAAISTRRSPRAVRFRATIRWRPSPGFSAPPTCATAWRGSMPR